MMTHDEIRTLFGENFEASVCDSTEGRHPGALGEIKKCAVMREGKFRCLAIVQ